MSRLIDLKIDGNIIRGLINYYKGLLAITTNTVVCSIRIVVVGRVEPSHRSYSTFMLKYSGSSVPEREQPYRKRELERDLMSVSAP